jgi:hypothetical protein
MTDRGLAALRSSEHHHTWDAGNWGVIVGVSRCKCRKVALLADFPPICAPPSPKTKEAGDVR